MRLAWRQRGTDAYFDVHSLSDGTLRFISLAALLLQPEPPSLILIDEPELSLHPAALEVLAGMLHSTATRAQLIVATQSVGLVNQCAPEDVLVVEQAEGESRFVRLEIDRLTVWLDEYGVGDLWQKNLVGGRPCP
ncbi:MAG: AAA family ATPase [Anaerolineae bacterium]|nr:AAA family ATPase [Anaerolineae bacterium]